MTIAFRFPVVSFYEDDPANNEVEFQMGYVSLLRCSPSSYEAVITERGWMFHLIFGQYQNGWYLCLPSKQFGCDLADPSDIAWNLEEMTRKTSDLDYEDATAIAYALKKLSSHIHNE